MSIDMRSRGQLGGWLLAVSLLYFILLIVVNVWAFLAHGIGLFAEITRTQMDAIAVNWALMNVIVTLTSLAGALGVALIANNLRTSAARRWAEASIALAGLSALAAVVSLVLRLVAMGFTGARLGDDPAYLLSEQVVNRIGWFASLLAIGLLCIALASSGVRRITGIVVGCASAVVVLLSLFAYDFLPPFLVGLLWTPVGITWLIGLRRHTSNLGS